VFVPDLAVDGRSGGLKAVVVALLGGSSRSSSSSGLIHRLGPAAGFGLVLRVIAWLSHEFGKGGEGVPMEVVADGPEVGVLIGVDGAREA
jgi:hypothetical protein